MNYTCQQSDSEVKQKRKLGLFICCVFIMIAMIFWIANYYLSRTSKLFYKLWDVNTVTAADFTA